MNLCRPDSFKSCAACCGLYNVADATKPSLLNKLRRRTALFGATQRSARAIIEYEDRVRSLEGEARLDPGIHVCEFIGFLDEESRTVGCLLHPLARGNKGVDFRGLCHYGSVACKSFFCPAWEELDAHHRAVLVATIDDWHIYGLIATDLNFIRAVFSLLEERLMRPLDATVLSSARAKGIFKEIIGWKNDWPFKGPSTVRQSRYYCRGVAGTEDRDNAPSVDRIIEGLRFTFDVQDGMDGAEELILGTAARFAQACV
jgi:hypothetical protein